MAYTTIDKPTDYFNTKLYTGNATTPTNITGVGFQPDWVWIKNRDNAEVHILADVVRGANKLLESNTLDAELSDTNYIKGFSSDGFQIGSEGAVNGNNQGHVAWNWLASNTTASNTDGSITSTVSANTTSGFSIVSYTGTGSNATVGHGLGSDASMVMIKNRDDANNWFVHHKDLGGVACLNLDTTDASFSPSTSAFQNPPLTSSFIQLATNVSVNNSGQNYIAYCFAEKKGFSKFGSYTGNNNADGNFIYTGMKPSFVIAKNSTEAGYSWELFDNKRNTTDGVGNVIQKRLFPDSNAVEGGSSSTNYVDFLSNGFKIRKAGDTNSNNTYIYMAFAESPFVTSTGIPTTAR